MNDRISWRELQPVAGGSIQWGLLAEFENELRSMKSSGLTAVIVVDDYPHWAVDQAARQDRQPTSCGRLLPDQYLAFAAFVHEVVTRYRSAEFNVHHWELGNEPDVDPDLVPPDSIFGCWGEISDREYYGGKEYGNMLKVVYPAIKSADPAAVVWLGGLLLDRPLTSDPALGHPENFIKGVLASGAGSAVDIIPYHAYAFFSNQMIDPDNGGGSPWTASGGIFLGKARYLRQILAQYGVEKPLVINETALLCSGGASCSPPVPAFYEMQADYLVRAFTRGLSENILGYSWYTLEGEGWRYSGLLHGDGSPKPVYTAYQVLTGKLHGSRYLRPVDYGPGIEGYAFQKGPVELHILWAILDERLPVRIAQTKWISAFDRDGNALTPNQVGDQLEVEVGFSPIYISVFPERSHLTHYSH